MPKTNSTGKRAPPAEDDSTDYTKQTKVAKADHTIEIDQNDESNAVGELIGTNKTEEANELDRIDDLNGVDEPDGLHETNDTSNAFCKSYESSSTDARDKTANLSDYIHQAHASVYGEQSIADPIFFETQGYRTAPQLHKDKHNRIIIYIGCFNPPHLGHLELLCHTFFRSDHSTIAAMIVPVGDNLYGKGHDEINGKRFMLTKAQRCDLLEHPLLQRFAWVHKPGYGDGWEIIDFRNALKAAAYEDGYTVSFVSLSGPDHYEPYLSRKTTIKSFGHGDGRIITSDISRQSYLFGGVMGKEPPSLPSCGGWEELRSHKCALVDCEAHENVCWPCLKFQELALHRAFPGDNMESTDLRKLAADILQRCHSPENSVWICEKEQCDDDDDDSKVLFFLCGGTFKHHTKDRDLAPSSTRIRQILAEATKDKLVEKLGDMALNGAKLLSMFGLDSATTSTGSSHSTLEDMENDEAKNRGKEGMEEA